MKVVGMIARLVQLPLCGLGAYLIFGTGWIDLVTEALHDNPMMEILFFGSLALIPWTLAKFHLVDTGLEVVVEQIVWLMGKLRGRYSVTRHLVFCMKAPVGSITQNLLNFVSLNLFVNAVPDSFEMEVPRVLRFLDADGDGVLSAHEIESFVYTLSSKIFSAFLVTQFLLYLIELKKPPEGWSMERSLERREKQRQEKKDISIMERYWQVTGKRAGWWTLLDRIITACLWIAMVYTWLVAVGIDARTVTAAGGAGGLALGLAAQQVVGNGVAALIILATAPCKVGDLVECGSGDLRYKGYVKEIGWNATAVLKLDNNIVYVPNSMMLEMPLVVLDPDNPVQEDDNEEEEEGRKSSSSAASAAKKAEGLRRAAAAAAARARAARQQHS